RSDGLLVLELPVVHDLADRRVRIRRNFNEIESSVLRLAERLLSRHDPDLRAVGSDQPDLGRPDPLIDAILHRSLNPSRLRYKASLPVVVSTLLLSTKKADPNKVRSTKTITS